jgi:hypothetical protein
MENFKHDYLGVVKAKKIENPAFCRTQDRDILTPVVDSTPPPAPSPRNITTHVMATSPGTRFHNKMNCAFKIKWWQHKKSVLQMFSV